MRCPISVEEKLTVTLRFLATGETYKSLAYQYQYRISSSTITLFIKPVCDVIFNVLKNDYMQMPKSTDEWENVAHQTFLRWQFPNCFGASDGKHKQITHPYNSGAMFINYKGFFSIVMLALVDFDYKFLYVDIGCQGRISTVESFVIQIYLLLYKPGRSTCQTLKYLHLLTLVGNTTCLYRLYLSPMMPFP